MANPSTENRYIKQVKELGVLGDLYEQHKYVSPVQSVIEGFFNEKFLNLKFDPKTLTVYDPLLTPKTIEINGGKVSLSAFEQGFIASLQVAAVRGFKPVASLLIKNAQSVLSREVYDKVYLKFNFGDPREKIKLIYPGDFLKLRPM